jgi:surface protein
MSSVTNASQMLGNADDFNQDIGSWDVSNVTDMSQMFSNAKAFNNAGQTLANWDTGEVTNMSSMFYYAGEFAGLGLDSWDVSKVARMSNMFYFAKKFSADLKDWDLAGITGDSGSGYGFDGMFVQGSLLWSKTQLENLLIQWELEAEDHVNLRTTTDIRIYFSGHGFALSALSSDAQTAATELRDTHGWAISGISGL